MIEARQKIRGGAFAGKAAASRGNPKLEDAGLKAGATTLRVKATYFLR
jgi:hypothetical protein